MIIENTQNIGTITMHPKARCFCPLGKDFYTIEYLVTLDPNKYYPDYLDVEEWVNDNINGEELTIEDAVRKLTDYFVAELWPDGMDGNGGVAVTGIVKDATHFPVEVTVYA